MLAQSCFLGPFRLSAPFFSGFLIGMRSARFLALVAFLALAAGCRPASPQPETSAWMERPAIYEVFVRDFSPEGNFAGVRAGLDRIEATGANIIWLMPIYPIGQINKKGAIGSPYAATDYRGIKSGFWNGGRSASAH